MLTVALLGVVTAHGPDGQITLGGRLQRALLASLVVAEGRPVMAQHLIDVLWDEVLPGRPVHALHGQVSRLRGSIPVQIERVAGGYRLDPATVRSDTSRFADLTARGKDLLSESTLESSRDAARLLHEALGLWKGPALGDLATLPGLQPVAVRLERLRQETVADRIEADVRSGTTDGVAAEIEVLLETSPLDERLWGQLLRALHQEGRATEALAAFQRARQIFDRELGSEPGPELNRLHESILRTPVGAYGAGRAASTLVGRTRELAALEAAWDAASEGLRLVTISGDAGIGKTRLMTEFASGLSRVGVTVLRGQCDPLVRAPYQPFTEMLRADRSRLDEQGPGAGALSRRGELRRILPELATLFEEGQAVSGQVNGQVHQRLVFDAVVDWLAAVSANGPCVLLVDDVQWADRQTLLLVRHLVRSAQSLQVLVLVTLRDREHLVEDPTDGLLSEVLRQSGTVHHLALGGLSPEEISRLLAAELSDVDDGEVLADASTQRIVVASGGNPLFVVELARQVAVGADPDAVLPAGLREIVDVRLDQLRDDVRDLVQHAAVVGGEFDALVVRDAFDLTDDELDQALSGAAHARLIEVVPGAGLRYAFCHDVFRRASYEAISPLRRSALHLRVAEALQRPDHGRSGSRDADLAHHYCGAAVTGGTDVASRAVHHLRRAGDSALEQWAPDVAVEHYRTALDHTAADDPGLRCDVLTALGTAEFHAGDPTYRETLLAAGTLAHQIGDGHRLSNAVIANNRGWWSSVSMIDHERVALIETALRVCDEADETTHLQLLAAWALENVRDPTRRDLSVSRSTRALTLAEGLDDPRLLAETMAHHFAVTYAAFSDPGGCVVLGERLLEIAYQLGDPGLRLFALVAVAQSTLMMADFDTADRALVEAIDLSERLENPARLWLTRSWEAMTVATRGDLDRAEELAAAAYVIGESTQPDALTWFSGQIVALRMMDGRLGELTDAIEEQVSSQASAVPAWRAAYALSLCEVGRGDEAETILDEFLVNDLRTLPLDMLWLHGMVFLCAVCEAVRRPDAARVLYTALEPHASLMAHNGTIDAGPVDLALATMALVMGEPGLGEKHARSAVDTCTRISAPVWQARALALLPAATARHA